MDAKYADYVCGFIEGASKRTDELYPTRKTWPACKQLIDAIRSGKTLQIALCEQPHEPFLAEVVEAAEEAWYELQSHNGNN
jgi:hypothetical protein